MLPVSGDDGREQNTDKGRERGLGVGGRGGGRGNEERVLLSDPTRCSPGSWSR